ncbi:hypothetical protein [Mycoplasma hafezii]|uniref:hypothetical protein n=1 Tax=Mycoplasma hafezii TaxID=525886 RepID=UPI003CF872A5
MINNLTNYFYVDDPISNAHSKMFHAPLWVLILICVLSLILSITFFVLYYTYSLKRLKEYKAMQLEDYKKENPKRQHITYEKTGMYLPSWERAKYNFPLFLGVVFGIMFVIFLVGSALS